MWFTQPDVFTIWAFVEKFANPFSNTSDTKIYFKL